jgi:hypothetical protein
MLGSQLIVGLGSGVGVPLALGLKRLVPEQPATITDARAMPIKGRAMVFLMLAR